MQTGDADLQALRQQLESVLENRISDLLGHVKAAQGVTRQIVATEEAILRQQALHDKLNEELTPLAASSQSLEAENSDLESKVDKLRDNVERMRALKRELMSNLTSLKNELNE